MRTLLVILGGLVLWGATLGVARLGGGSTSLSSWTATGVFAVVWFVLAAANMWIGISRAGYSFLEELPIFLVIYLLPVTVAVFAKWKFM